MSKDGGSAGASGVEGVDGEAGGGINSPELVSRLRCVASKFICMSQLSWVRGVVLNELWLQCGWVMYECPALRNPAGMRRSLQHANDRAVLV
jgi:hypothetical protein